MPTLPLISAPPVFVVRPTSQRLVKSTRAKLDCLATGNPPPTMFWMKEGHTSGILLPGHEQGHVRVTQEGSLIIGKRQHFLVFKGFLIMFFFSEDVSDVDSGFYSCAAASEWGSVLARAELRVVDSADALKHPPIIELGPSNQTLKVGSSASLPCEASGQDQTVWLRDGIPVLDGMHPRYRLGDRDSLEIRG